MAKKLNLPHKSSPESEADLKSTERGRNSTANSRSDAGMKRYNLVIPEELYNDVQRIANAEHTTVVDLLRRFIKLGLIATRIAQDSNASLIIREGNREREILFLT